jgi:hypothetical protein
MSIVSLNLVKQILVIYHGLLMGETRFQSAFEDRLLIYYLSQGYSMNIAVIPSNPQT